MPRMADLTEIPAEFQAGTTLIYTRTDANYPATSSWTRTLYLAGSSVIHVNGVASGADFVFTLTAVQTEDLKPGLYQWREVAAKSGVKYLAASGTVTVLQNIASAGAGDMQSWEEVTLKVVEDVLAGRITADTQAYSIAGRAVTKIPVTELVTLRSTLRRAVETQRHPGRLSAQARVSFTGLGSET